ncbi:MAG: hypothetical protein Q7U74_13785, partial [Saprospiraceae bacterium]|nr:hypothetical protein [Saprospiraceae bacterium]
MRTYITLLGILWMSASTFAQRKHDHNWIFGSSPSNPELHYGGVLMDFNVDSVALSYFETHVTFSWDKASISDRAGNLIAYTNGCQVQNRNHELMENGDNINEGPIQAQYCAGPTGAYVNEQGALFLPVPGSDSLYALFHLRVWATLHSVKDFLYTLIDASSNNGLGKVTVKNQPLFTDSPMDTLTLTSMVTACRHANGRDWWIVVQENYRNLEVPTGSNGQYHFFLFDPQGVHYQG